MDSFGINFYKILLTKYFGIKVTSNKKLRTIKLHNFLILQLILIVSPSSFPTTTHSLVTIEHKDSFGINSIKIYDAYMDIQTISNKKVCTTKL